MSQHTSGPWRVRDENPCRSGVLVSPPPQQGIYGTSVDAPGPSLRVICNLTWTDSTADEAKSNARLIAAAPDLLSALEAIVEHHTVLNRIAGRPVENSHTIALARTAIEKARGDQP